MEPARTILFDRRKLEAARCTAAAAVNIADGDLTEARTELHEVLRTIERLIQSERDE